MSVCPTCLAPTRLVGRNRKALAKIETLEAKIKELKKEIRAQEKGAKKLERQLYNAQYRMAKAEDAANNFNARASELRRSEKALAHARVLSDENDELRKRNQELTRRLFSVREIVQNDVD